MATANKSMNVEQVKKTMMDFERQNMQMDMTEEMSAFYRRVFVLYFDTLLVSDSIDGIMDGEEDEEESQNIMDALLDEIGIDIGSKMASAPIGTRASPAAASSSREDEDLQARLDRLRA